MKYSPLPRQFGALLALLLLLASPTFSQNKTDALLRQQKGTLSPGWIQLIRNTDVWELQRKVEVVGKRIKESPMPESAQRWQLMEDLAYLNPYKTTVHQTKLNTFSLRYFPPNLITLQAVHDTDSIQYTFPYAYEVVHVSDANLVLEELKDPYCFDFVQGKKLTEAECEEKHVRDAQDQFRNLFGGGSRNKWDEQKRVRLLFQPAK